MAAILRGRTDWSGTVDESGHRTYKVTYLVETAVNEGPATVLQTPGLPAPGATWNPPDPTSLDVDIWAWRRADAVVKQHQPKKGERHSFWEIELTFSTKPSDPDKLRCQTNQIEDPLLELPKVKGSGVKYTEEARHDRHGEAILTSSHEQVRGPQVEFDKNRPRIEIEQNVASADQGYVLPFQLLDYVNDSAMWGFGPRCVKLSEASFERKMYGTCSLYYTRVLVFDVNNNKFDRRLTDEGTKVLKGHWSETTGHWVTDKIGGQDPNPDNPAHFIRFKDVHGENSRVILNGEGLPYDRDATMTGTGTGVDRPGEILVEKYDEANLLLLGIPTSF